jgi:F-type H+-transporting ATPase subunit delta
MKVAEIAKRYARALYDLASETKKIEAIGAELNSLVSAISMNLDLVRFTESPLVRGKDKELTLKNLFAEIKMSEETSTFVMLLAQKGRLELLGQVAAGFQQIQDKQNGISRGFVRTARKLSDSDRAELQKLLSQVTGKQVEAEFAVDPAVVAGIQAQVGSLSIDDSVTGHLNRMREELNRRVH